MLCVGDAEAEGEEVADAVGVELGVVEALGVGVELGATGTLAPCFHMSFPLEEITV